MNEAHTYLPSTDDECDERLVKVLFYDPFFKILAVAIAVTLVN
jgi:hypothetical protein